MTKVTATIQEMRDQQLSRALRAVAIVGFFALLSSLSRSFSVGWQNVMYLHIALYLIILALVLSDKHVPYSFRAATIIAAPYLLGVGGLLTWGLAAFSLLSLYSFCILSTIGFGIRAGISACVLSLSTIACIGACYLTGALTLNFDALAYLNSAATWATALLAIALSAATIVVALGTLNGQVEGLVHALAQRNEELLTKNRLLEQEIKERIEAEEKRKQLEAKLQLARKMESIGMLAGGVAHDLNNTLGSVVGYPDVLLEELSGKSHLRETVESIKKSGLKAAAIVNDMLTLARAGVPGTDIVDFNAVISEYCASPEFGQLKAFHPKMEAEFHRAEESLNVRGSFFRLSKIITNLVSNAAEAMPDGGRIFISTGKRVIDDTAYGYEDIPEGEYAVLQVADTGTGISADDLGKIFEPFYTKKTMGRSGTGLGMAVVWGSVKDHNGYITVKSAEGEGTCFTVYLPLTKETPPAPKHEPAQRPFLGHGESILIVDDVREQREIASLILSRMGYSVQTVGSGEEAVAYLSRTPADLLILDMLMEPGMDGLETYRKILAIRPEQKALIATGFAETSKITEAEQLGVGGYLKKPYLMDQIGHAVRAELDRNPTRGVKSAGCWN